MSPVRQEPGPLPPYSVLQYGENSVEFAGAENSNARVITLAVAVDPASSFYFLTANFSGVGFFVVGYTGPVTPTSFVVRGTQPGHAPVGNAGFTWMVITR